MAFGFWNCICYGNGNFVAVGYDDNSVGLAAVSSDAGDSWSVSTLPPYPGTTYANLWSVGYGDNKFVAVGSAMTVNGQQPAAWTSPDGYTWAGPYLIPNESGTQIWGNAAFPMAGQIVWVEALQKFVATVHLSIVPELHVSTSSDGITWTPVIEVAGSSNYGALSTDAASIVWVDETGSPWTSVNGTTWVERTLARPYTAYVDVLCYGDGKFLWPGSGSAASLISNDGVAWAFSSDTTPAFPATDDYYGCVRSGPNFIACGTRTDNGDTYPSFAYSTDGITWTRIQKTDLNFWLYSVATTEVPSAPPPVTLVSISVAPDTVTLSPGVTQQLTVTGHYSNLSTATLSTGLTYAIDDGEIGDVDASGLVTAGNLTGTATVTVTHTATGITATSSIEVVMPTLLSLSVAPVDPILEVGASRPLEVTGHYSDASTEVLSTDLTFDSGAPSTVMVDGTGNITASAPGLATVSALHVPSGLEGTTEITVFSAVPEILAIGSKQTGPTTVTGKVYRSRNHGASWAELLNLPTSADGGVSTVTWFDMTYGNGTYFTVGYSAAGVHFAGSQDGGDTWSIYTYAPPELAATGLYGDASGVAFGNDRFVVVGERRFEGISDCKPCAWVSLNGITWSGPYLIPTPNGDDNWAPGNPLFATANQIVWSPSASKFVTCVSDANVPGVIYMASSADGITWTTVAVTANRGPDNWVYGGLAASPSTIVYLAYDGTPFTSTNGVTWTQRTQGNKPAGIEIYTLAYGGGKFLWPGNGIYHEYYSTNGGLTWQVGAGALQAEEWSYSEITYDGTNFILCGSGLSGADWYPRFAYSATGLSWTETTYPSMTADYYMSAVVSNML